MSRHEHAAHANAPTVHSLRVLGDPNGKAVVWSGDGGTFIGHISPWVLGQPDGDWYGKRSRQDAGRFSTRHAALAHVVGGCPDPETCPGGCPEDEPTEKRR